MRAILVALIFINILHAQSDSNPGSAVTPPGTKKSLSAGDLSNFRGRGESLRFTDGQASTADAASDCNRQPCAIFALPRTNLGTLQLRNWDEHSAILDMRPASALVMPRTFTPYNSGFQFWKLASTDDPTQADFFTSTRSVLYHFSGGTNPTDQAGAAKKDSYYGALSTLFSGGMGQEAAARAEIFKHGSGEAIGNWIQVYDDGNCLSYGDECVKGTKVDVQEGDGTSLFAGKVTAYTTLGHKGNIAFDNSQNKHLRSLMRWIINTTPSKIHSLGRVVGIDGSSNPTVTFEGAMLSRLGIGAHSDLCFSQVADDQGLWKLVVPVGAIVDDNRLQLNHFVAGASRSFGGTNNGSDYRIYRCAQIQSFAPDGLSDTSGGGNMEVAGSKDWAPGDTFEEPPGYSLTLVGSHIYMNKRLANSIGGFPDYGLWITNAGASLYSAIMVQNTVGRGFNRGLTFANSFNCAAGGPKGTCTTYLVDVMSAPDYGLYFRRPVTFPLAIVDGATYALKYISSPAHHLFQFYASDAPSASINMNLDNGDLSGASLTARQSLSISGGTPIRGHRSASSLLTFGPWQGQDCFDRTVSYPGANDGDEVSLGVARELASRPGIQFSAFVSDANEITVRSCKITSGAAQPVAGKVRIGLWQH